MEYEDIDIHINQSGKNYAVFAIHSRDRKQQRTASAPPFRISSEWSNRLERMLQSLNLRDSQQARAQATVMRLGEELFEQLFRGDVLELYQKVKYYAKQYKHILRLYLHITPPQLVNYPWEILREPNLPIPLCLSIEPKILLIRCTYAPINEMRSLRNPKYSPPLRILGMASNSSDDPYLNIAHEKAVIESALEKLKQDGSIALHWKEATAEELSQLKKDASPWHVFHFIGHGHFDEQTGEGQLNFQDTDISAAQLSKELPASIPLILLNACDTARGNNFERTSSVAYKLASEKRFAVIGMQFKVSDDAAIKFAQSFYTQLANRSFIDEAVAEARQEMYRASRYNPLDWAAPVLYTNVQRAFAFQPNTDRLKNARTLPDPDIVPLVQPQPAPILSPEILTPMPEEIPLVPPRKTLRERYKLLSVRQRLLCGALAVLLVCSVALGGYVTLNHIVALSNITCNVNSPLFPHVNTTASPLNVFANEPGMGTFQDTTGETVGLSNGSTIFDQEDQAAVVADMQQAAQARINGDQAKFDSSLRSAQNEDPANAEAKIYAENDIVLAKQLPYITLVLGIALTSTNIGGSRDILQGAYVAQKEYNDQIAATNSHCPLLVLLLANSGSVDTNAATVAEDIIQVQKANKSIIGVVGWSLSSPTINAINTLNSSPDKMWMISPNATSDDLEGIPHLLRIVSSDKAQVQVSARYAYNILHAKKVAIFYQTGDSYSASLAAAFQQDAPNPQSTIFIPYTTGDDFAQELQDQVKGKVDVIYIAGLVGDATHLLDDLPSAGLSPTFPVMGGDGLAVLNDYLKGQSGLNRLVFTTYAAIDPSSTAALTQFLHEYQSDFDTSLPPHLPNGLNNLDSDVMLSYEAVKVFLRGYQIALNEAKTSDLTAELGQAFYSMNGSQAFQGLNGPIAFQQGGPDQISPDPINSTVFIAHIANGGVSINAKFTCNSNTQICSNVPINASH